MKIRECVECNSSSTRHTAKLSLLFLATTLAWHLSLNQAQAEAASYQGFGATTPGGA